MTNPMIDRCDVPAYRAWTSNRTGPAYMRGMPTWMWRSALTPAARRRAARVT